MTLATHEEPRVFHYKANVKVEISCIETKESVDKYYSTEYYAGDMQKDTKTLVRKVLKKVGNELKETRG